jgi:hypothetical protein
MERIAIAMQDVGAGAGARHEEAARAARPTSFCLAAEPLYGPPGRGLFGFRFSSDVLHRFPVLTSSRGSNASSLIP